MKELSSEQKSFEQHKQMMIETLETMVAREIITRELANTCKLVVNSLNSDEYAVFLALFGTAMQMIKEKAE